MKYRTKDCQDYTLPGIGRTVNGFIVTDKVIENPNFELVEEETPAPTPQPQPIAAAPAQPAPATPPAQAAPQTNQGSAI